MKHRPDAVLRPAQARYLDNLLPPRDDLVREMEEHAERDSIPISDPEVARLLEILARARQPKRVLEIGTAIGYGALHLARGAPEARVVSLDPDAARLAAARGYLERAGVAERVELLRGEALALLPRLCAAGETFEMAYIDAVKSEYRRYLDLLLPALAVGGLVVVDNLLWKGWVADPPEEPEEEGEEDEEIRGDRETAEQLWSFNSYFMTHPQMRALVLPLGDGVGLATKTRPLILEMGGPF